jgi:hypothetical protein
VLVYWYSVYTNRERKFLAKNAPEVRRVDIISECWITDRYRAKKILFCRWMLAFELNPWICEVINACVYLLCLLTVLRT